MVSDKRSSPLSLGHPSEYISSLGLLAEQKGKYRHPSEYISSLGLLAEQKG
ncbi:hypothetical protein H105_00521, partial [Trichophyton soudanense CBS 452.61]